MKLLRDLVGFVLAGAFAAACLGLDDVGQFTRFAFSVSWGMTIIGIILIIIAALWWRREGVSAERPASLLAFFGVVGLLAALLTGCGPSYTDDDMAGCATRSKITMGGDF